MGLSPQCQWEGALGDCRTCPSCVETTPGLGEQDIAAPRSQGSQPKGPTTLSYSSSVSLSPAVLLKLLVLEEEREMFDLPFSFSLMNGLGRRQNRAGGVTWDVLGL